MENKQYCFIGNGIDASECFDEVYDSEAEAIAAAKYEYDNGMEEHLGYLSEDEDDETLNPLITICEVEEFDTEKSVKRAIENFKDSLADDYFDFESSIDDADVEFGKGFNEEMFKVIMPLVDKYFSVLGCTQRGHQMYDVDITKLDEKTKCATVLLDANDVEREMREIYPKEGLTFEQFAHMKTLPKPEALKFIKEHASCVDGLKSAAIYYDMYVGQEN